ncbi:MAG: hypothetical protein KKH98_06430 [Spirochaetes bacterium]|nr:hypothetical protein [Spirochaetota bacterium]
MEKQKPVSKGFKVVILIFISVFFLYTGAFILRVHSQTSRFKVVINPEHGGRQAVATTKDGDRYDPINHKYTVNYDQGVETSELSEYDILYRLSLKIKKKLNNSQSWWSWGQFEKILTKYGKKKKYDKIVFDTELTKKARSKRDLKKDINRRYRLFDHSPRSILKSSKMGILSLVKKFNPDIVINLNFNYKGSSDNDLFSITVPDVGFFKYIKDKIINKDLNFIKHQKIINAWYGSGKNAKIKNLLNDTWVYFTGLLPDGTLVSPSKEFLGHGQNLLMWKYSDKDYIENYRDPGTHPQYARYLKNFKPVGKFWEREAHDAEKLKRAEGDHNMGDNTYMSEEMIKYIIAILNYKSDAESRSIRKGRPVFSYDPFPLYVNSLVINVNLGSILNSSAKKIFTERQEEVSDAVCVALYSICKGFELKDLSASDIRPDGNPVDFKKYYKHKYFGRYRKSYK